jgi:hypothetical protein
VEGDLSTATPVRPARLRARPARFRARPARFRARPHPAPTVCGWAHRMDCRHIPTAETGCASARGSQCSTDRPATSSTVTWPVSRPPGFIQWARWRTPRGWQPARRAVIRPLCRVWGGHDPLEILWGVQAAVVADLPRLREQTCLAPLGQGSVAHAGELLRLGGRKPSRAVHGYDGLAAASLRRRRNNHAEGALSVAVPGEADAAAYCGRFEACCLGEFRGSPAGIVCGEQQRGGGGYRMPALRPSGGSALDQDRTAKRTCEVLGHGSTRWHAAIVPDSCAGYLVYPALAGRAEEASLPSRHGGTGSVSRIRGPPDGCVPRCRRPGLPRRGSRISARRPSPHAPSTRISPSWYCSRDDHDAEAAVVTRHPAVPLSAFAMFRILLTAPVRSPCAEGTGIA